MSKRDRDTRYITYDFKQFDRLFADQAKLRLYLQSYCLLSLIIILYDTSRIVSGKNMFTHQEGFLNGKCLSGNLRAFRKAFWKECTYQSSVCNSSY
jgi:hypothetical protein